MYKKTNNFLRDIIIQVKFGDVRCTKKKSKLRNKRHSIKTYVMPNIPNQPRLIFRKEEVLIMLREKCESKNQCLMKSYE